jgi:hypothetical protein
VFLTRPPLPGPLARVRSFDLHVLGTPPAFILSQDQTRHPSVYGTPLLLQKEVVHELGATYPRTSTLARGGEPAGRSCDPGQTCLRSVKHLAVRRWLSMLPLRQWRNGRKLTGTACLLACGCLCVTRDVCLEGSALMSTLSSPHAGSSCCVFCFPLFNCSGPLQARSKSKDSSLTRDSLSQSTPPATPSLYHGPVPQLR